MKTCRWMIVLTLAAAVGVATLGCDSSDSSSDSLVGSWRATTFNGQPIEDGLALAITFNNDGSYVATTTVQGVTDTERGTWSIANGILTTVHQGRTEQVAYALSGNTLTLTDRDGTFTLRRQ
jgi:hypothetical protein